MKLASLLPSSALSTAAAIAQSPATAAAPVAAPEPSLPYTVKPSDKLIRLTRDLLVRPSAWNEVARFNQMKDPNFIRPGQQINIPLRLLKFQAAQARIISVAGNVQLGGAPATVGMAVPEGARLATGPNSSAVVQLGDGSQVKMLPQTLADVVNNREYAMRDASASGSTTWFSGFIRLSQGTLETLAATIQRRATPLQIETPTSLVGVRGTQFRVAFDDPASRNARTEVVEGNVRADNPAQQSGADLPGGTGAKINPAEREVRVVKLLPPPDLSALPSEVNKPQALLPMPVLPGAASFRVQVASDEKFDQIVRDLKVTTASVNLGELPNTTWYTRVRGIDADGIEGFDSVKLVAVKEPVPIRWRLTGSTLSLRDGQNRLVWATLLDNGQPLPTQRFRIELATDAAFANVLQRQEAAAPSIDLGALKAGTYYLRLVPLLPDGKTLDAAEYRMDLSANWGETVFDNGFPLVPLASR